MFSQNWEIRPVFTKKVATMAGDTKKKKIGTTRRTLENTILGKKIRAWHYATHKNHVWNRNNQQIYFGDIKVVNNMN